jgi:hypothetical protein
VVGAASLLAQLFADVLADFLHGHGPRKLWGAHRRDPIRAVRTAR